MTIVPAQPRRHRCSVRGALVAHLLGVGLTVATIIALVAPMASLIRMLVAALRW
jgi:hypothetical protein